MFKRSGQVSLLDVKNHFGTSQTGNEIHINDYYAGGNHVEAGAKRNVTPEQAALDGMAVDQAVPTSGALSLANLYGIVKSRNLPTGPTNFSLTGVGDGAALTTHIGFSVDGNGVLTWRIWNPNGAEEQQETVDMGMGNIEVRLSLSGFSNGSGKQNMNDGMYPTNLNIHDPMFTAWSNDKPVRFKMGEWFEPRWGMDTAFTVNSFGGENKTFNFTLEIRQINKPDNKLTKTFDVILDNRAAVNGHFPRYYYMDSVMKTGEPTAILLLWNDPNDATKQYMTWQDSVGDGSTFTWNPNTEPTTKWKTRFLGTNANIKVISVTGDVTFSNTLDTLHPISTESAEFDDKAMRLTFRGTVDSHTAQIQITNDEGDDRTMELNVKTVNKYNAINDSSLSDNAMFVDDMKYDSIKDLDYMLTSGITPELEIVLLKSDVSSNKYDYRLKVEQNGVASNGVKLNDVSTLSEAEIKVDVDSGIGAEFNVDLSEGVWHEASKGGDKYIIRCAQPNNFNTMAVNGKLSVRAKGSILPPVVVEFGITVRNEFTPSLVLFENTPDSVAYTKSVYGHQKTGIVIEKVVDEYYWKRLNDGQVLSVEKIGEFKDVGLQCRLTNVVGGLSTNIDQNEWVDVGGDGGIYFSVTSGISNSTVSSTFWLELRQKEVVQGQTAVPWGGSVKLTAANSSVAAVWHELPDSQYNTVSAVPMKNELRIKRDTGDNVSFQADYLGNIIKDPILMAEGEVEVFIAIDGTSGDMKSDANWTPNVWLRIRPDTSYTVFVETEIYRKFVSGYSRLIIRDYVSKEIKYDNTLFMTAKLE
ncbi:hypothetical protein VPHK357_0220 [Vibrio phage K357]